MHTIYIQKIHTKHDKTEHKWKYTCIYIYIKPLRLDTKNRKTHPIKFLGMFDNTMGSGF